MSELVQLQLMTGVVLALGFLAISLGFLRKRHMNGRNWASRGGALIYSLIFAGFVSIIIVPLQLELFSGGLAEMSEEEVLMRRLPGLLFFLLIIRSDVTGRLPMIGTYIRAYRSAVLRRTIEGANKRLEKMQALENS